MDTGLNIRLDEVTAVHSGEGTLYHSLGHVIRSKIQSGELVAGEKIPSERELIEIFDVSRATVQLAIKNLVLEGLLYRVQGKGTFVSPPKIAHRLLPIMDFSDLVEKSGITTTSRLLAKEKIKPPAHIQKMLGLMGSDYVIWLQRLILITQMPILIETSYFPFDRFPDLIDQYDGIEEPHRFLHNHYGVKFTRAQETFEPVILEKEEAEILGTKGGFPALWVELTAYEEGGKPSAYFVALLRGDRCRTYIDLVLDYS
jgi:GntR family transcriptional regulator